ncbi:MAG: hypothetical protein KTR31_24520 [Myxococcales bacterium]|nr:hypothetical protein [Myxococcales bacterium]
MLNRILAGAALSLIPVGGVALAQEEAPMPELRVHVDRLAQDLLASHVKLNRVRVRLCAGGSFTLDLNREVDLVAGISIPMPDVPLCAAMFEWGSELSIVGHDGQGEFALVATPGVTRLKLGPGAGHPPLRPLELVDGDPASRSVPRLFAEVTRFHADPDDALER